MRIHLRKHTGEKPYKCTYCDSAFARGDDLKAHIRRQHTGERFQCDLCSENFRITYLLTVHKRNVHGKFGYFKKFMKCSRIFVYYESELNYFKIRNINKEKKNSIKPKDRCRIMF